MISVGLWILGQVLDAVVIFGRSYVNVPGFPLTVEVWFYHDVAYALLRISCLIVVIWEITPWKPGQLTSGRVVVALLGFALLTAAPWISQDMTNAILVLGRTSVDLPFFVGILD